jgi:glutathionyl-hydroquinone reductase
MLYICDGGGTIGDVVTEADLRLLPTLLRFDAVYAPLFLRQAQRTLGGGGSSGSSSRYPATRKWMATLYALPGVQHTLDWPALLRRSVARFGRPITTYCNYLYYLSS